MEKEGDGRHVCCGALSIAPRHTPPQQSPCIPRRRKLNMHAALQRRPAAQLQAAPAAGKRLVRPTRLLCRSQHAFLLYTKPDCPLCDGLKDKVQALLDRAQFMPCFLTGATLEVRDVSTNEAWQDAMHLSVPVLAVLDERGSEVMLPRPQPRVTAERLQRHLEEALQEAYIAHCVHHHP